MAPRVAPGAGPGTSRPWSSRTGPGAAPADRLPGHRTIRRPSRTRRPRAWTSRPRDPRHFDKLGISCRAGSASSGVAVDAVFDSVSVATTFKAAPRPASSSARSPRRSQAPGPGAQYLGTVVPPRDNFFAALNSAVFTDGSFCSSRRASPADGALDVLPDQRQETGQFERTLIIADEGASVSYLEGCTAPMRDENQLHAAVVELVALDDADDQVLDRPELVSRRRRARAASTTSSPSAAPAGARQGSWTQVETGSAITWKYPELHPPGRRTRSASSTRWR